MYFTIFLVLFLVLAAIVSGLLAASERTIIAIRASRIRDLINKGSRRAEYLRKIRSRPENLFQTFKLSSMLFACAAGAVALCLTIFHIFPGLEDIFQAGIAGWPGPVVAVIIVIVISMVLMFSVELFSRLIASRHQLTYILWASAPVWYLMLIMRPLTATVNWLIRICLMPFGISWKAGSEIPTGEAELKLVLREGFHKGLLGELEMKMLRSIFEFSDTTVRRAMTPRTEITAVDINYPVEKILKIVTEENFSRYPVYEDNIDNIKGIIHSRDLLFVFTHKELFMLKDIIRVAHFVPESKPIAELMREMKKHKFHMAIVVDEFGGTGGIITMEDVIEEIVGDIQDEYDRETSKLVFARPDSARVKASMPIDEFANEFGVEFEEGEFDTVGGMIVTRLGRIPLKGEIIEFDGFTLEVIDKEGHRIKSLLASKTPKTR